MRRVFTILIAFLAIVAFSGSAAGQWWDDEWQYRRQITIPNLNSNGQLDKGYTINITINHSELVSSLKSLANGDDIRIVFNNSVEIDRMNMSSFNSSETSIAFSLQEDVQPNSITSDYWIYYGNPNAATPPSDANKIFLYYQPFNSLALGPLHGQDLWSGSTNFVVEQGTTAEGSKSVRAAISQGDYIITRPLPSQKDIRFSGYLQKSSSVGTDGGIGIQLKNGNIVYTLLAIDIGLAGIVYQDRSGYNSLGQFVIGDWYQFVVDIDSNGKMNVSLFDASNNRLASHVNKDIISSTNNGIDAVDLRFHDQGGGGASNTWADFLQYKKFSASDPKPIVGGEEVLGAFSFSIESPSNITYSTNRIDYNITFTKNLPVSALVSVDDTFNFTLINDTPTHFYSPSHPSLAGGQHRATFYATNSTGGVAASSVEFLVNFSAIIESPANRRYLTGAIDYNITTTYAPAQVTAVIDGTETYTLLNDTPTHFYHTSHPSLVGGVHRIEFFVIDPVSGAVSNFSTPFNVTIPAGILTACGQPVTASGLFILTANVSTEGTCFTVQAHDVVLDCEGNGISYAETMPGHGISTAASGIRNITVLRCVIGQPNDGADSSPAIFLDGSTSSTIIGNTILTHGKWSPGIHSLAAVNNFFVGNTIDTTSHNSSAISFTFVSVNNTIRSNRIGTQGTGSHGISLEFNVVSDANTIDSNNVTVADEASNTTFGILLSSARNSVITTNNLSAFYNLSVSYASLAVLDSSTITITGNAISTMIINRSVDSSVTANTFSPRRNNSLSLMFRPEIVIENSNNITLSNNTVFILRHNESVPGILLSHISSSAITSNVIIGHSEPAASSALLSSRAVAAVVLDNSNGNVIHSNIVSAINHSLSLHDSGGNTIYNNLFNVSRGEHVNFSGTLQPNTWNVVPSPSTNILGDPLTAGNAYADLAGLFGYSSTCTDVDDDGLCDIPLTFAPGNGDGFPLALNRPGFTLSGIPRIGSPVTFTISDPSSRGFGYILMASTSTQPPYRLQDGRYIFLTPNSVFFASLLYPQNLGFSNAQGILSPRGRATVTWQIPPFPGLAGLTLYFSFVSINASEPIPQAIKTISPPIQVTLQP